MKTVSARHEIMYMLSRERLYAQWGWHSQDICGVTNMTPQRIRLLMSPSTAYAGDVSPIPGQVDPTDDTWAIIFVASVSCSSGVKSSHVCLANIAESASQLYILDCRLSNYILNTVNASFWDDYLKVTRMLHYALQLHQSRLLFPIL